MVYKRGHPQDFLSKILFYVSINANGTLPNCLRQHKDNWRKKNKNYKINSINTNMK